MASTAELTPVSERRQYEIIKTPFVASLLGCYKQEMSAQETPVIDIWISPPNGLAHEEPSIDVSTEFYAQEGGNVPLLSIEQEVRLAQQMELATAASLILRTYGYNHAPFASSLSEITAREALDVFHLSEVLMPEKKVKMKRQKANDDQNERIAEVGSFIKIDPSNELPKSLDTELLEYCIKQGQHARTALIDANFRLVANEAQKINAKQAYTNIKDLKQEGQLGLFEAVERFQWRLGFKLSTYAVRPIKQAINRLLVDDQPVSIPYKGAERRAKIEVILAQALTEGRESPSVEEIAAEIGASAKNVREILRLITAGRPASLDEPVRNGSGNKDVSLKDVIAYPMGDFVDGVSAIGSQRIKELLDKAIADGVVDEETVEMLLRYYGQVESFAEVARRKGISPSTISKRVLIARERLHEYLQKQPDFSKHP